MDAADELAGLGVGGGGDGAGVDDVDVGLAAAADDLVALCGERAGDLLGVALVDLAAEGEDGYG